MRQVLHAADLRVLSILGAQLGIPEKGNPRRNKALRRGHHQPAGEGAGQEIRGSIPSLVATISEIGYLLLSSHDMAEISLKRRKSNQLTSEGR